MATPVYKSGQSLTVKSEKETDKAVGQSPGDRNNYFLKIEKKKVERQFFFIFTKFGELHSPPADPTRSNQLQMGVTRYLSALEIKTQWP